LRKLSSTNQGLTDLLKSIQNNMLVIQAKDLKTEEEVESSTTHGLIVQHSEQHRRLSSGNIARNLGGTLDLLEPSGRESSDSA
jgi:hypothetical protein